MIAELVGHYRVVANLGSGGMGVVWKAIDTRLNRPVALKAIRDTGPGNTDAVLRLRAEALAAASLDHPYICKIYELLETGSATMVVMEFVEGETLGDILGRRTPPLVDTLRYGSEIAEGLANAHARGIVHRDIKPSNVMVTPHGHIKLLDFGIARVSPIDSAITQSASGLTMPGDVPGTPQYMAPEQALGRPLDGRTDLFSLGVVLFRCLTGQLPFEGQTRDEYVQEMLSGRMRPLDELAPATPLQVREIVKACLQREPDKRPESAAIVADTLRRAADAMSTGSLPIAATTPRGLQRWALQVALLAFAIIAGVFALLQWAIRPADDIPRELRPAVTWQAAEWNARISPNGDWLSFISDKDTPPRVWMQAIATGNAVPVDIQGAVVSHAWSPDGRELACVVRQGDDQFLTILPAFFGGSPRLSVGLERGAQKVSVSRWAGDHVYIFFDRGERGQSVSRVTLKTGEIEDLTASWKTMPFVHHADVSPDGGRVALEGFADGRRDLWLAEIDGTNLHRITDDEYVDRYPLWVANDTIAFQRTAGGQVDLWQMSVSTRRPVQLTTSPQQEIPTGSSGGGATIVFEQVVNTSNLWRLELGTGALRQLTGDALGDLWPSTSDSGSQIAFQRTRPTVTEGWQFFDARVLVAPLKAAAALEPQATIDDGFAARLSADGRWVAYYQRLADPKQLRLRVKNLATGEGRTLSERAALPGIAAAAAPTDWVDQTLAWTPQGARVFFVVNGEDVGEIHQVDLNRGEPSTRLAVGAPKKRVRDIRVSPDGERLAWVAGEKEAYEIHVLQFSDSTSRVIAAGTSGPAVYLPGWASPSSVVVAHNRNGDGVYELALSQVGLDGVARPIAVIEDAAVPTMRVDTRGGRLFVTRNIDGIHNVFAVSLRDGKVTKLTANESPGVSFAGVHPLGADAIVFGREERKRDLWLVQRKAQ